jgi:hypothetical protein
LFRNKKVFEIASTLKDKDLEGVRTVSLGKVKQIGLLLDDSSLIAFSMSIRVW